MNTVNIKLYYWNGSSDTKPTTLPYDLTGTIVLFAIQAAPGSKFKINSTSGNLSALEIILGETGIFELDLKDVGASITSISIPEGTFNKSDYIIIDYVVLNSEGGSGNG